MIVESKSGLIPDPVAASLAISRATTGVHRHAGPDLAGDAHDGRRSHGAVLAGLGHRTGCRRRRRSGAPAGVAPATPPPIVLNEWAARELHAAAGTPIELEYLRWADEGRLVTDRATFQVAGIMPMRGLAIDQATGAGLSGHHDGDRRRRLGSAIPDRSRTRQAAGRRVLGSTTARRQRRSFRSPPARRSGGPGTASSRRFACGRARRLRHGAITPESVATLRTAIARGIDPSQRRLQRRRRSRVRRWRRPAAPRTSARTFRISASF